MSERQVTVDGVTHSLGSPFFVLATQNPYEFEGTYPLPESQLDRFLMRLHVGYPNRDAERQILNGHRTGEPVEELQPVLSANEMVGLQQAVRQVAVEQSLSDYLLDLVAATRHAPRTCRWAQARAPPWHSIELPRRWPWSRGAVRCAG